MLDARLRGLGIQEVLGSPPLDSGKNEGPQGRAKKVGEARRGRPEKGAGRKLETRLVGRRRAQRIRQRTTRIGQKMPQKGGGKGPPLIEKEPPRREKADGRRGRFGACGCGHFRHGLFGCARRDF